MNMDFSNLQEGMTIEYKGDSWSFGGTYKLYTAESTYRDPSTMPEHEKGKLMIVELTNNDQAMFFTLDRLNPEEWKLVE